MPACSSDARVKVKICGITNAEDALHAVKAGCDAVGFIFYRKSPRYITPEAAQAIIRLLPRRVMTVGVFVNARAETVAAIARRCGLKALQFHGAESPGYCRRFRRYTVIKSFRVGESIDFQAVRRYTVFALLFDTFSPGSYGGTGKTFRWKVLAPLAGTRRRFFLSGGLNAANVGRAVAQLHPAWVDASSALEVRPGKKDPRKVTRFIATVRRHGT